MHTLPAVLPAGGELGPRGSDGRRQGPPGQAGRGRGRRRSADLPAQTLSEAHERHGEVTQGHPGAGGHGEVLREGERNGLDFILKLCRLQPLRVL